MSIEIPKRMGYAGGNLRGLSKVLQEIVDAIDAVEIPDASDIGVADAGEHYTGENVEAVLQEIPTLRDTAIGAAISAALGDVPLVRTGTVALNGVNPTKVAFGANQVAEMLGSVAETFNLSAGTDALKVTPDGEAEETVTFEFTDGKHEGANTGLGDISGQADYKFKIAVDDDVDTENYQGVELTLGNCDTGANTAAEMQTKIQALGGDYASVTVAFAEESVGPPQTGTYTITSGSTGYSSKVRIAPADDHNVTEELKIGAAGTDTDGEGAADPAASTAGEVAQFINDKATNFEAEAVDGYILLKGKVAGGSLVIGDAEESIFGFTNGQTEVGAHGLGYDTDMANDEYVVVATPVGVNKANKANLEAVGVNDKSASGFELVAPTDASDFEVDLVIIGEVAAPA